jgi:hypothetical protein
MNMNKVERQFFKITGVRPKDLEPHPTGQEMENVIRRSRSNKPEQNFFRRNAIVSYSVQETGHDLNSEPYTVIQRKFEDGTYQEALLFNSVDRHFLIQSAQAINETDWEKNVII